MGYSFKDVTPNEFFYGMGEYIDYLRMRAAGEPVDDMDIDPDATPVIMLLDNLSGENITSLCGLYATFVNALLDFEKKCAENCGEDDDDGLICDEFQSCDECPHVDCCPYNDDDDEDDEEDDDDDDEEEDDDEDDGAGDGVDLRSVMEELFHIPADGRPITINISVSKKPKK